jgi:hypothetical protein
MWEVRNAYKIWSEEMKGIEHLEDFFVAGKIIFKWILDKLDEV